MKINRYASLIVALIVAVIFNSCQDEDQEFGNLVTPSNLQIEVIYLDDIDEDGIADETSAPGLGSGEVKFIVTADNALNYQVVVQGENKLQGPEGVSHIFSVLGDNTYSVTAIATGTGGVSSSKTIEVDVLSLYEPPADLIEMLYADGSRVWRIKSEANGHFGLGPAGGDPFNFFSAPAESKAGVGMYDDRYIFNEDGTFTHIVDGTNDDPVTDTSGTVFGREVLINDTIWFIRELPPKLVDAFSSTLEDSIESDLLLHVIDANDSKIEEKIGVVEDILEKIWAKQKRLYVFNKIDEVGTADMQSLQEKFEDLNPIFCSAYKNIGMEELKGIIVDNL